MRKILFLFVSLCFTSIGLAQSPTWLTNFALAKIAAKNTDRLILVDFWATWCGPCKKMDADVWSKEEAELIKKNFIPLKIDIDNERGLATQFGIRSIPHIILMTYEGEVIYQQNGYTGKDRLLNFIKSIPADVAGYYSAIDTKDYKQIGLALQGLSSQIIFSDLNKAITGLSDKNFKRAIKNSSDESQKKEVELLMILNSIIRGREKKAIEELTESSSRFIGSANEALYWFTCLKAFQKLGDQNQAEITLAKLKRAQGGELYISKLNSPFP